MPLRTCVCCSFAALVLSFSAGCSRGVDAPVQKSVIVARSTMPDWWTGPAACPVCNRGGNLFVALSTPHENWDTTTRAALEKIGSGAVPSIEGAQRAAIAGLGDHCLDANTSVHVFGLWRLGSAIPRLGDAEDYVWEVRVSIRDKLVQYVLVNARTGQTLPLLPQKRTRPAGDATEDACEGCPPAPKGQTNVGR